MNAKKDESVDENRLLSGTPQDEEEKEEVTLRPQVFGDIIGRKDECEAIRILIDAAKQRKEAVDHILFHGPPGLGKTTFAHVVANEMSSQIRVTSGPAIERQGDLAAILTNLQPNDVLFIDEIHRLKRGIEEILYPAMEDFMLDFIVGKGPSARSVRLKLAHFTLIGATTKIGSISSPLRDRFGFVQRLDYFDDSDISDLIIRAAGILSLSIDKSGAAEIARRSRGTARVAQRMLKRVRDYSQVVGSNGTIDKNMASNALDKLGVDEIGLDDLDRKILRAIIEKYSGGPVGLSTIAAAVSEELETIADVYEPFLMQKGLIKRTSRGRVATELAYTHLGLEEEWKGSEEQDKSKGQQSLI
ncbi:Holliday junction branch migration DNA helicase RuvB [Candidatus Dojkabacteria bacterium]|nr:Holliday junction branch migration DNA helicase RuvB [Candidatus Dojkabacteria bacterium]